MTRPDFAPEPVSLQGEVVRLEPMGPEHAAGLAEIGGDDELWQWMPRGALTDLADAEGFVRDALALQATGSSLPFVTVHLESGRVVGSTRYLDIRPRDRALEIGWTWLGREALRTAVNTECKWLLMIHAFERLGAVRVQFKTDARNLRSQAALERIGAVKEGVLRKSYRVQHDFHRDSVYYSVLDEEWPVVKAHLEAKLGRG